MPDRPFRAVVHLAARAGIRQSVADPHAYFAANVDGTLNVLEGCRQRGGQARTGFVVELVRHRQPPAVSRGCRHQPPAVALRRLEKGGQSLAYTYHHLHGLDVSVLRCFTVYGPAGRPDMAVFRLVRQIAEGEPVVVYGDGSQQRDFTYSTIPPRACWPPSARWASRSLISAGTTRCGWRPSSGGSALLDRRPQIQRRPAQAVDLPATWADVSKARRLLDWQPQVDVDEGLRRCVDWYVSHRDFARTLSLGDA